MRDRDAARAASGLGGLPRPRSKSGDDFRRAPAHERSAQPASRPAHPALPRGDRGAPSAPPTSGTGKGTFRAAREAERAAQVPAARRHAVPAGSGTFDDLGLIRPLLDAVRAQGYETPTPIQVAAIPHVLAGRDLLGCARTGTGKTAGFALPMLQLLAAQNRRAAPRTVRALVVVPTRELATQVAESFRAYGAGLDMKVAVIFGGVSQGAQVTNLSRGLDVLVATPGRLVDLMGQRHARLDAVEILVLDEADHMLDLGFLPDVKRILAALPKKRQTLFFSATMPPAIGDLADRILVSPEKVYVTPAATTAEAVEQFVHFVERSKKPELLRKLLAAPEVKRALVFTRTKRGGDKVAKRLTLDGIPAQAIHGNKTQGNRERTLASFRDGRTRVLVATDIAARGIDVEGITHVVNYELPNVPETYVHRIGRTARAGATGIAIAFCDGEERPLLRDIEKLIKKSVPVASGSAAELRAEAPEARERRGPRGGGGGGGGGARGGAGGRGGRPQRGPGAAHGRSGSGGRGPGRASGGPSRGSAPTRLPTVKRAGTSSASGSRSASRGPSSSFGVGV